MFYLADGKLFRFVKKNPYMQKKGLFFQFSCHCSFSLFVPVLVFNLSHLLILLIFFMHELT